MLYLWSLLCFSNICTMRSRIMQVCLCLFFGVCLRVPALKSMIKKIKITPSWRNKIMHSFHKLSSQIAPMMATISANYTRRAPFESLLRSLLTGKLPQETHVLQVIRRDTDLFTLTCWTWFLRNESTHLIMLVLTLILYNFPISIRGIIVLDEQSIKSTQM